MTPLSDANRLILASLRPRWQRCGGLLVLRVGGLDALERRVFVRAALKAAKAGMARGVRITER